MEGDKTKSTNMGKKKNDYDKCDKENDSRKQHNDPLESNFDKYCYFITIKLKHEISF